MRNWRSDSVTAVPIAHFNGSIDNKISDPKEGTSKQYDFTNQSVYVSFTRLAVKMLFQVGSLELPEKKSQIDIIQLLFIYVYIFFSFHAEWIFD